MGGLKNRLLDRAADPLPCTVDEVHLDWYMDIYPHLFKIFIYFYSLRPSLFLFVFFLFYPFARSPLVYGSIAKNSNTHDNEHQLPSRSRSHGSSSVTISDFELALLRVCNTRSVHGMRVNKRSHPDRKQASPIHRPYAQGKTAVDHETDNDESGIDGNGRN